MRKKYCISIVLSLILLVSFNLQSTAQENIRRPQYKHFKIVAEIKGDTITLRCLDGCAWQELSFVPSYSLKGQAVNQYGLTKLDNLNELKEDKEFADFLLTINRKGTELIIKGNKGVHWESLIIPCNEGCQEFISEKGFKSQTTQPGY